MSVLREMSWYFVLVAVMASALIALNVHGGGNVHHVHHVQNVQNVTARTVAHDVNYCASLSSVHGKTIQTIYPC